MDGMGSVSCVYANQAVYHSTKWTIKIHEPQQLLGLNDIEFYSNDQNQRLQRRRKMVYLYFRN